ncbi:MAG: DUF5615 family PIN-like protein [Bacteroidota bacterium]
MKILFQADADLNQNIVKALLRREPTIDFKTAVAANLDGLKDLEVLTRAAQEGRLLVTHDRRTMPQHFAELIAKEPSSGVIIVPQNIPLATVVDELILIWLTTEAEEWLNRISSLPIM